MSEYHIDMKDPEELGEQMAKLYNGTATKGEFVRKCMIDTEVAKMIWFAIDHYLDNLSPDYAELETRVKELEKIIRQQKPKPCDVCKFSKKDKTCKGQTVGYGNIIDCNFEKED